MLSLRRLLGTGWRGRGRYGRLLAVTVLGLLLVSLLTGTQRDPGINEGAENSWRSRGVLVETMRQGGAASNLQDSLRIPAEPVNFQPPTEGLGPINRGLDSNELKFRTFTLPGLKFILNGPPRDQSHLVKSELVLGREPDIAAAPPSPIPNLAPRLLLPDTPPSNQILMLPIRSDDNTGGSVLNISPRRLANTPVPSAYVTPRFLQHKSPTMPDDKTIPSVVSQSSQNGEESKTMKEERFLTFHGAFKVDISECFGY